MALTRVLGLVLLSIGVARAWDMTSYYNYSTEVFGGNPPTTLSTIVPVVPTGPVTGTSTSIITTSFVDGANFTYAYTLTSLFLAPSASWCAFQGEGVGNVKICSGTTGLINPPLPTSNSLDQTRYFVPVLITPPASCTMTSFSYTSSVQITPFELPGSMITEITTGTGGEALFITTYVEVISTDLGGQPITATVVEVFLKTDAVQGVTPIKEKQKLTQCVDPSVYYCFETQTPTKLQFGCGPNTPITYPPLALVAGATGGTGSAAGAAATTTTSKKSGAMMLKGVGSSGIYLAVAALAVMVLA